MKNWRSTYPYVGVKRTRQFEDEKFEISDSMPPTVVGKNIDLQTVYFVLEDAKRFLSDKCRRGHRLNAVKLNLFEVQELINQIQDFIDERADTKK